ncbi:hypothetical protein ACOJCM_15500 [Billgrantia sp. LNSP4103-1]|uniref:hypothetical protein n=1 Tax=Billgrantia sp. LNSP4103-1 TaxID=3410266 RepID=UPI00403F4DD6
MSWLSTVSEASGMVAQADGTEPASIMRSFLAGLRVPFGEERSAKFRPARWSTRRQLFSVPVQACGRERLLRELPGRLHAMGMAPQASQAFLEPLQGEILPHYLHFGIEDERCKAYWEAALPDRPPTSERFVLYRAWKWVPGEAAAESDYVLVPSAPAARREIAAQLAALPPLLADLLEQLEVGFALAQTAWPPLTVRIEERQQGRETPRHSLNLHLHQARLPLGAIAGLLLALAREWQGANREAICTWIAAHGNETLGNLSFGVGNDGLPFLTCYHGARAARGEQAEQ